MPNPFGGPQGRIRDQAAKVSAGVRGAAATLIPGVPDPQLWFDFTDASTVWEDTIRTIPATNGGLIRAIDNKGTDPNLPFLDETTGIIPTYRTGDFAGLNVAEGGAGTVSEIKGRAIGALPGANGMAMAMVSMINDGSQPTEHQTQWDTSGGATPRLYFTTTGPNWFAGHKASGTSPTILRPVTNNEWVWLYLSSEDNNFRSRASGSVEQVDNTGTYIQNNDNEYFKIDCARGKRAMSFAWDTALTPAQLLNLIAYFDSVFGVLPI